MNISQQEQPATILIVDDRVENIEVLNGMLSEDYRILFATGGREALEIIESQQPDLVLLDVMMPDLDGYEVCRRLRQMPAAKDIPVIFVTAKDQDEDEELGLEIGAVDYLTKPVRAGIARQRIRIHLELKRHRDYLQRLSAMDGLTGIPNRRRFDEFLAAEWQRALRGRHALSVVLMDVDHFKNYNDTYGHGAGDECLKQVAQSVAACLPRRTDLAARYGGEEFVAVLPQTDHGGAVAVAERIRQGVESRGIEHSDSSVADHVTVSVGVASITPSREDSAEALLKRADERLYQAKEGGRNRVVGEPG